MDVIDLSFIGLLVRSMVEPQCAMVTTLPSVSV